MTYIYDNSIMFISLIAFFIYWIQIIYKHKDLIKKIEITDSKVANLMKEEMRLNREEFMLNLKNTRQEISENFALHLNNLTLNNLNGIKDVRNTLEYQLENLRKENEIKLEQMRMTVDEKLNSTLEKRLNQSFKLVGDRLDQVNLGIGEMQRMATEVNNLQKVLGNIKTRGIFGEEQLDRILSDFLTPEQFERNVKTKKGSNAIVEFAVKLPGNDEDKTPLWLPIDSKFPIEDYQRIIESTELGNTEDTKNSIKQLELKIKLFAKEIKGKYIDPPYTTDFGILFLPTEGLYSEVLRINGLQENLRREHNVVITGPSTLVALLNSLQMGFRTLAVEKRSNEIRKLLGTIKKDFSRFGELLEKTQEKLDEASKQIGEASHRSKIISNKLTRVETLPQGESLEYISYNGE
ncbi:DNA recombination protein RmuC [Silvanigrella paludirubra]|uniref:DNA recombination protein RmuC n=1 Tax=Silvanigrella paludirubra TaxID=2499159 RepID=A0A6N6VV43_9BACT|nr:DNA recombination protein RmuC [Silvanigrella paludirubra]KAB8039629.1 DNA recombination protein RmuC [Silvanigrella paludirubra]